ncbi:hypothetical protein [Streptacidiphilus sp. MAP12-16]|uniref:hypothetical protein n=1 Tax=Streptacidiphilus sp. MAP12-16 TaxID=3156300 RepID=UPI0035187FE3
MRRASLAVALLVGAVPGAVMTSQANAVTPVGSNPAKYLGTWNYDLPNRTTMRNIAVISGQPTVEIPQIGWIVFSDNADGSVTGRTDQGCTWNFEVRADSLDLAGSQSCFNHVVGSAYTITDWTVRVSGHHENESLTAISHLPTGDRDFVLQDGARTKTGRDDDSTQRFVGGWTYAPANPQTLQNIVATYGPGGSVTYSAETGTVAFAKIGDGTVAARTPDGCTWNLRVQGNTAELQPAVQTCELTDSTATLTFWSIASDGRQQDSVIAGTDVANGQTSAFSLSVGNMSSDLPR